MTSSPLAYPGPLARGARDTNPSGPVHRLQGWLALHGYDPGPVDGDFGPSTEKALEAFQRYMVVLESGMLTQATWQALTSPLARAMAPLHVLCECGESRLYHPGFDGRGGIRGCSVSGSTCTGWRPRMGLGEAVAAVARQWLAQRVGGGTLRELPVNSGPVVEACTSWLAERDRLPCFFGHEGHQDGECLPCARRAMESQTASTPPRLCEHYSANWRLPWCAGWLSTVLRQACESLGVEMPIKGSLSCDVLAKQAKEAGLFTPLEQRDWRLTIPRPGDIFLVRGKAPGDWVHCGIVLETLPSGRAATAEGNTNEDGSRNGTSLLERKRHGDGLDFICWRGE